MKLKTEKLITVAIIMLICGFLIGIFNDKYGAFFLFGGAIMSFLYEYFGLIRRKI